MEWSDEIIEEATEWWEENGGLDAVKTVFGELQEGVELGVVATNLGFEGATAAFMPQLSFHDRLQYFARIMRRMKGKHAHDEAYVRFSRFSTT